jgi:hypothetical protein
VLRDLQHRAGKRQLLHLLDLDPDDYVGIVAGRDLPANELGAVDIEDELDRPSVRLGDDVDHTDKLDIRQARAGFLEDLAAHRLLQRFARLDAASGKRVEAQRRCAPAPDQQEAAVVENRRGDGFDWRGDHAPLRSAGDVCIRLFSSIG